jgi:hypothetical protein
MDEAFTEWYYRFMQREQEPIVKAQQEEQQPEEKPEEETVEEVEEEKEEDLLCDNKAKTSLFTILDTNND